MNIQKCIITSASHNEIMFYYGKFNEIYNASKDNREEKVTAKEVTKGHIYNIKCR
jgi:hypothetical protein